MERPRHTTQQGQMLMVIKNEFSDLSRNSLMIKIQEEADRSITPFVVSESKDS